MKKITYNLESDSIKRSQNKPLTLIEENRVIELINLMKFGSTVISEQDNKLIQRFIWHYENLNHHAASLEGLYATDDQENSLFKIQF